MRWLAALAVFYFVVQAARATAAAARWLSDWRDEQELNSWLDAMRAGEPIAWPY